MTYATLPAIACETPAPLRIGATVRPLFNGEDTARRPINWDRLRGVLVDLWDDGGELRAEVRWHGGAPYPSRLPADWLTLD
jgi:hypothetical protein